MIRVTGNSVLAIIIGVAIGLGNYAMAATMFVYVMFMQLDAITDKLRAICDKLSNSNIK